MPHVYGPRRTLLYPRPQAVLLQSLTAFWELEEASGTRNDSYGAHHLTDNNTVTSAAGKVGTAAEFVRANSEFLSLADADAFDPESGEFTVAGWVYLNALPGGTQSLIGKGGGGTRGWNLWVMDPANVRLQVGSAAATPTVTSSETLVPGSWYFIAAWRSGDNILVSVNNGTPASQALTTTFLVVNNGLALRLGSDQNNFYLNGLLDQWGFWRRALTAAEREWLYNSGAGRTYAALRAYTG